MSNLKGKLIRVAYANPEIRPHVLPILKEAGKKIPLLKGIYGDTAYEEAAQGIKEVTDYAVQIQLLHWIRMNSYNSFTPSEQKALLQQIKRSPHWRKALSEQVGRPGWNFPGAPDF